MGYSPFLGGGTGGSAAIATASGVGGYEDRGLTGSLHTSRGLVLLELGRTTDAVTALHEAVRVLGASGGGDAAGGAGVAGTLLSRALELWALEGRQRDHTAFEESMREASAASSKRRGSTRSREHKGKERVAPEEMSRRRGRQEPFVEGWTEEVAHVATATAPAEDEKVEMDLDDEADGLLRRALDRVRHSRQRRPAVPSTPDMDANEPAAPSSGRSRGTRHGRSHSRQ